MTEAEELAYVEELGRETAALVQIYEKAKEYFLAKHTKKALKDWEKAKEKHEQSKTDNVSLTKLMGAKAYERFLKYMR